MPRSFRFPLVLLLAMASASATAHPLHGNVADFTAGFAHPFMGLDHLVVAAAIGIWAARLGGRALWIVPLSFAGAMLAGAAIGLAGWSIPPVESMTAASALALGLLILMRRRSGLVLSAAVAAFFALFHGMAHVEQVAPPLAGYLAGLLAATALLHVAGIAAARRIPSLVPAAGAALAVLGCWWMALAAL